MVLAPNGKQHQLIRASGGVINGFALSFTDFALNNKLHINFSTPQYSYKSNDFKVSYTALGLSLKFTHKI